MSEREMIAARLHLIADQIEGDSQEDILKKEFLENLKKNFVEKIKSDPNLLKNRDPEQVWRAIEKAIRVDIKRILCADFEE